MPLAVQASTQEEPGAVPNYIYIKSKLIIQSSYFEIAKIYFSSSHAPHFLAIVSALQRPKLPLPRRRGRRASLPRRPRTHFALPRVTRGDDAAPICSAAQCVVPSNIKKVSCEEEEEEEEQKVASARTHPVGEVSGSFAVCTFATAPPQRTQAQMSQLGPRGTSTRRPD